MKRFIFWLLSILSPYRPPNAGMVSQAMSIDNATRKQ